MYFPSTAEKGKISVGAERQRRYRAMKRWRDEPTEENFWGVVLTYTGVKFKTYSGLPFSYEVRKGRNGEYTKNCGSTDGRRVKVWHGVQCCWHCTILKR